MSNRFEGRNYNPNCDWFADAKYGIFVHYLNHIVNDPANLERGRPMGERKAWNDCVESFDAQKFAEDMQAAGAGYVIFTIHQSQQYFCIPNATYDALTGAKPGENCACRDLIGDVLDALEERGIPLMLYFTGDGIWKNPDLMEKIGGAPFPAKDHKPTDWTPQFKKNWFAIAREWSLRYGKRIAGWWIDGADACKDYNDDELLEYAEALRAGNPDSIVCFNPGNENLEPWRYSVADDFTAGESAGFDDYPEDRWVDGAQWHLISYTFRLLNKHNRDVDAAAKELIDYIRAVSAKQGVVSIDLSIYQDGSILEEELAVLKQLKEAVR